MPKTLLLADDSVTIQKVVGISFANEDVTLLTVDNGDDAISRAREARPDLVLADVVMPGKNGYEVCAAIKNDPEIGATPVMLLTGTFEAFDDSRAREVGADGHITKPFEAQALVDRVNQLLEQAGGTSESTRTPEATPEAPIAAPAADAFDEPVPAPVASESESFGSPAETPPESWTAPDDFGTTPMPEPASHIAPVDPAAPPASATSMTPPPIPEVGESSGFAAVPPPVSAAPTPPPVPDTLAEGDLGDGPATEALTGSYDFFEDEFGANATPESESTSTSYGFGATTDGSLESAMSEEIPSNFDFGDSQLGSPAFPAAETNVTTSSLPNETAGPDSFSDAQTIPPSFDSEFDDGDDEPNFDATTAWERPPAEAPAEAAPSAVTPTFEDELETTALPESSGNGEVFHAEDVVEATEDANFVDDPDEPPFAEPVNPTDEPSVSEPATTLPLPEPGGDDSPSPFEHGFGTEDRDELAAPFSGMDSSGSGAAITGMDAPIDADPYTPDTAATESTGAFGDAFGSLASESQQPESFQDPAPSGSFDVAHEDVAQDLRAGDEAPGPSFAETMPISDTELDDSPQGDHDLRSSNPAFRQEIHDAIEKIAWEAMGPVAEAIVRDCVDKVERVAWEVIPEMAEKLIREEIRRLKGEDQ